jgi:hypothetical protein
MDIQLSTDINRHDSCILPSANIKYPPLNVWFRTGSVPLHMGLFNNHKGGSISTYDISLTTELDFKWLGSHVDSLLQIAGF